MNELRSALRAKAFLLLNIKRKKTGRNENQTGQERQKERKKETKGERKKRT